MDAYKVSVSLVLQNGVSGVSAIIAKDLLGIQGSVKGLSKEFEGWKGKIVGVSGQCQHANISRSVPCNCGPFLPR